MDAQAPTLSDGEMLAELQRLSFDYFVHETNPRNGLIADRTREGSPASIAAVGLALSAYPVGTERGFISRAEARGRTLTTLRFLWNSPQGPEPDAAGYKGFFYHFVDMDSGRRIWRCELSTVDTALLFAGVLAAGAYFDRDDAQEHEIRTLADALYRRVDWAWALNGGPTISHGWRPERGFLPYRWEGYDEALILYILALGSPSHPIPPESYAAWLKSYRWRRIYGREFVYAGPLFIHQLSHLWIDFRGIRDAYMRERGSDYFENSCHATYVQQEYAVRNPRGYPGYRDCCWGVTASDGPGPLVTTVNGTPRRFYGYLARGAPFGPDDGTLSPWAALTSLPFTPDIVMPAVRHFHELELGAHSRYGFAASFNPSLDVSRSTPLGWVSAEHIGINQGPICLMIENHQSGQLWKLMQGQAYVRNGLRRAGFSGGWL